MLIYFHELKHIFGTVNCNKYNPEKHLGCGQNTLLLVKIWIHNDLLHLENR